MNLDLRSNSIGENPIFMERIKDILLGTFNICKSLENFRLDLGGNRLGQNR